jgi:hypothetical protein
MSIINIQFSNPCKRRVYVPFRRGGAAAFYYKEILERGGLLVEKVKVSTFVRT